VLILVMIVELLNTAVEAAIDRIGPEWHDLSKRAKDMGSAAVLLALLLAHGHLGPPRIVRALRRHERATPFRSASIAVRATASTRAIRPGGGREVGTWIGEHGGQLVYGGGNNGLMGTCWPTRRSRPAQASIGVIPHSMALVRQGMGQARLRPSCTWSTPCTSARA
jgi:hypothetical protein